MDEINEENLFLMWGGWALGKAYEYREAIFRKVSSWLTTSDDPRKILIIGPGGVGKTTLAALLSSSQRLNETPQGEYEETISIEEFTLKDDPNVKFIVPPGQEHRMDATWSELLEDVVKGSFRGVILVTAYGHHAIGDFSYRNHRLFKEETGLEGFLDEYIKECLSLEEQTLTKLCDAMRQCTSPIWFLNVVTKQDLWWPFRDEVDLHYRSGNYSSILRDSLGSKSPRNFRNEVAFVSLVIRNLTTGRDELLKQTTAGYDQVIQVESLQKLIMVLNGLMEWEK